jgi:hypothetical protein
VARRVFLWPTDRIRETTGANKWQEGWQAEEGETVVMGIQRCPIVPGFPVVASEVMDTQGFTKVGGEPNSFDGEVTARAFPGSTRELVKDREIPARPGKTEVTEVKEVKVFGS